MQFTDDNKRGKIIVFTSVIGIVTNVVLALIKVLTGIFCNSIAIVLDAVNNLSDALSSVITIIGTRLAGKEADRKHPFGYGRIEYLSSLVISVIVLYAGITSLTESLKKIPDPQAPEYSTVSLILIFVAVMVKIFLGLFVKHKGEQVNSDSLINSGKDALLDSVISSATLVAAFIFLFTGIKLEAFLGAVISLVIIKAGIEMLSETVSKLLGEPGDISLLQAVKTTVRSFPEVKGAYDLVLHNYGPDTYNGSIHIELDNSHSLNRLDMLTREITDEVYNKHQVLLTAVGIYSVNTDDKEAAALKSEIGKKVLSYEHVKQMHGFFYNRKDKTVRFDIVISFDAKSRQAVFREIKRALKDAYPDITFSLAMDMDYGEIEQK